METNETEKLKDLIAAYMKQESCNAAVASHCITRVCQFLGFTEPTPLVAMLESLEAESFTVSAVGIRRTRYLRALFDCAIMAVLPTARQTFATVITNAQHVRFAEMTRH